MVPGGENHIAAVRKNPEVLNVFAKWADRDPDALQEKAWTKSVIALADFAPYVPQAFSTRVPLTAPPVVPAVVPLGAGAPVPAVDSTPLPADIKGADPQEQAYDDDNQFSLLSLISVLRFSVTSRIPYFDKHYTLGFAFVFPLLRRRVPAQP